MWSSSKLFSVCIRGSAFLFQGPTMCFICIIVITSVGRRPAAAPGNYQMRPVFLPSFFVPLWITQIARSKHLARTRASLEAVLFFFFFFTLMTRFAECRLNWFFWGAGEKKRAGENQQRFLFLLTKHFFSLTWCITLNFFSSVAQLSVSTEHPYYWYVQRWCHVSLLLSTSSHSG